MELANRDEIEAGALRQLAALLAEWDVRFRGKLGDPPDPTNLTEQDFRQLEHEFVATLLLLLQPVWEEGAVQLVEAAGVPISRPGEPATTVTDEQGRPIRPVSIEEIRSRSLSRAAQQAEEIGRAVVENTRQRLSELFTDRLQGAIDDVEFEEYMARLFSDERAENIASTEVTRAGVGGIEDGRGYLRERGIGLTAVWHTRQDNRVCPVCAPLHGEPEEMWRGAIPSGPPAHNRCRCWLDYVGENGELN